MGCEKGAQPVSQEPQELLSTLAEERLDSLLPDTPSPPSLSTEPRGGLGLSRWIRCL